MSNSRAFQPALFTLEERLALSGMTATPMTCPPSTPTGAEILAAAAEQATMATFEKGYQADVTSILEAPGPLGFDNPWANRADFDSEVNILLDSLEVGLASDVKLLPNSAVLTSDIEAVVTGPGPNSLKSELMGLSTPGWPCTSSYTTFEAASLAAATAAEANLTSDVLGYGLITPH